MTPSLPGNWSIWQSGNLEPLIVPPSAGLPDRLIAFLWGSWRTNPPEADAVGTGG
jgi:hypothetical protein